LIPCGVKPSATAGGTDICRVVRIALADARACANADRNVRVPLSGCPNNIGEYARGGYVGSGTGTFDDEGLIGVTVCIEEYRVVLA
jgi:hypothetical protein